MNQGPALRIVVGNALLRRSLVSLESRDVLHEHGVVVLGRLDPDCRGVRREHNISLEYGGIHFVSFELPVQAVDYVLIHLLVFVPVVKMFCNLFVADVYAGPAEIVSQRKSGAVIASPQPLLIDLKVIGARAICQDFGLFAENDHAVVCGLAEPARFMSSACHIPTSSGDHPRSTARS
ncbi:hypothetical protein BOVATA_036690 [Babesia ovata]|uniref:Uncharacterized protein n=1 Tax=Babesia ovata TaxID=189622 RepID=A0A2H6KGR0_9APIC|nr:uncharacterized protein BOVATA_036690 [Babesia ovata]GBE62176.1 hypothetical protein BOVATA_036690 [Babesia ovata]